MKTNSALRFFACIILMGCMAVTNAQNKYTVPSDTAAAATNGSQEDEIIEVDITTNSEGETIISGLEVDQKPSYPGGDAALYRWLALNIQYPEAAAEDEIQGKVVIAFIIEKDGSISNARVERKKHPALDAEALRVIKKMPRWKPGYVGGKPVRVLYHLPITFKLSEEEDVQAAE